MAKPLTLRGLTGGGTVKPPKAPKKDAYVFKSDRFKNHEWLTSGEACELLNVSAPTFNRAISSGEIRVHMVNPTGRERRFLLKDLLAHINDRMVLIGG